jgi:hypothetical protein
MAKGAGKGPVCRNSFSGYRQWLVAMYWYALRKQQRTTHLIRAIDPKIMSYAFIQPTWTTPHHVIPLKGIVILNML